jgi:hypothetical protein
MPLPRFDRFARPSVQRGQPLARRRLLAALGLAGFAAPIAARAQGEQPAGGATCEACRLLGITGGGVVRLSSGDANLVVFASRSVNDAAPPSGVVRWMDPNHEGGVLMENVGAVLYDEVEDAPRARELRGLLRVNGAGEQPFVLRLEDVAGEDGGPRDRCRLLAGDAVSGTTASGWSYQAEGDLVGGDLVLLQDDAAPS